MLCLSLSFGLKERVWWFVCFFLMQGCVYVKCLSPEYAGKAFKALHGSWFDGKNWGFIANMGGNDKMGAFGSILNGEGFYI